MRFRDAKAFVTTHHRHHKGPQGHLFSIGVAVDGIVVGVIVAGRPVSRMLDDGRTVEFTRCCTTGHENACSRLYGAAKRAAKAIGYRRAVTYTLASENGASVKASGFVAVATTPGGEWTRVSRSRDAVEQSGEKTRWECML